MYNRTDGWFKTRRITTGYNQATTSGGPFQSGVIAIMEVYEVSRRAIVIDQEFRNLGCWSWMLL